MLYIAQAPQLKLNEDDFVKFPDVSHLTETFDKTKWKVGGTLLPRFIVGVRNPPLTLEIAASVKIASQCASTPWPLRK